MLNVYLLLGLFYFTVLIHNIINILLKIKIIINGFNRFNRMFDRFNQFKEKQFQLLNRTDFDVGSRSNQSDRPIQFGF